jgi:hypothetical protein
LLLVAAVAAMESVAAVEPVDIEQITAALL